MQDSGLHLCLHLSLELRLHELHLRVHALHIDAHAHESSGVHGSELLHRRSVVRVRSRNRGWHSRRIRRLLPFQVAVRASVTVVVGVTRVRLVVIAVFVAVIHHLLSRPALPARPPRAVSTIALAVLSRRLVRIISPSATILDKVRNRDVKTHSQRRDAGNRHQRFVFERGLFVARVLRGLAHQHLVPTGFEHALLTTRVFLAAVFAFGLPLLAFFGVALVLELGLHLSQLFTPAPSSLTFGALLPQLFFASLGFFVLGAFGLFLRQTISLFFS